MACVMLPTNCMDGVKMRNKKCTSKIQELISVEELVSLCNLKAEIERKENRRNRRKEREKHNGRW